MLGNTATLAMKAQLRAQFFYTITRFDISSIENAEEIGP